MLKAARLLEHDQPHNNGHVYMLKAARLYWSMPLGSYVGTLRTLRTLHRD
jgi:hypothetical protein